MSVQKVNSEHPCDTWAETTEACAMYFPTSAWGRERREMKGY